MTVARKGRCSLTMRNLSDHTGRIAVSGPGLPAGGLVVSVRSGVVIDVPPELAGARGLMLPAFVEGCRARGWRGADAGPLPVDRELARISFELDVRNRTAGMERGQAAVVRQSIFARRSLEADRARVEAACARSAAVREFLSIMASEIPAARIEICDVVPVDFAGIAADTLAAFEAYDVRSVARFETCRLCRVAVSAAGFGPLDSPIAWDLPERGAELYTERLKVALFVR